MLGKDEDAVICDLAETYHILDMYSLPVELVAVLVTGLRTDSRIKLKLANVRDPMDTLLLAALVDNTAWLKWSRTRDAEKGVNPPESIFKKLIGADEKKTVFKGGAEFDEAKRLFDLKAKQEGTNL